MADNPKRAALTAQLWARLIVSGLADDLFTFIGDAADISTDPDFQMRARVLVARVAQENKRLARQG